MAGRPAAPRSEVLFSASQLREAAGRVAAGIEAGRGDSRPVLVGVLTGSAVFLADVLRASRCASDLDFLSISPFGRGRVRIEKDLSTDIAGRHVVIVEDIVDTGLTLAYLLSTLGARGPATLEVATLLKRPVRRLVEVPVRWAAFEVDDRFVVGYGMDFEGRYRNLREVRVVTDLAALAADPDLLVPEVYGSRKIGPGVGGSLGPWSR